MKWSGFVVVAALLLGCGGGSRNGFVAGHSNRKGNLTFHEAGEASYRFALSGQILDEATQSPIPNFSLSLLSSDSAVTSVINGLGNVNGLFHLSRNPSIRDDLFAQLPVLISAAGFEPIVQNLDLGADCKAEPCTETRPLKLLMKARSLAQTEPTSFPAFSAVTKLMEEKGISTLFKAMTSQGKADAAITGDLARANNRDLLTNVLVVLKPTSPGTAPDVVAKLLGSVPADALKSLASANAGMASALVPLLSSTNPKLGHQLVGISGALSYLSPLMGTVSDHETGPLGQIVAGLLTGPDTDKTWMSLAQALQAQRTQPQLAMPMFLPFSFGTANDTSSGEIFPFANAMKSSLRNPSLLNFISSLAKPGQTGTASQRLLLQYAQPLLQGLVSKNAPEIATLLNSLVQQDGLMAIKDFATLANHEKFVKLAPYLEPLIRGLNSQDSPHLAAALMPFLEQKNPALALRELLTKGSGNLATKGEVAAAIFPALPAILNQAVPAKQIFSAQLLSGLVSGDLSDVKVTQDLSGMAGLILSGQARDIFKIAQLPNVERLMALPATSK